MTKHDKEVYPRPGKADIMQDKLSVKEYEELESFSNSDKKHFS